MNSTLAIHALCIAAFVSIAPAQQVLGSKTGQSGERFGTALVPFNDQDGDGVVDLLVGAPGANGNTGALYCISGQTFGTGQPPILLWITVPPGAGISSAFGTTVTVVGNLVGDATPDILVGAPNHATGGSTTGALYLLDGANATTATLVTGHPNSRLGRAVAAVGDQNADGKPDIIATVSATTNSNLRLVFVPGTALMTGGSLSTLAPSGLIWGADQTGENLATGFDHDGDGRLDFAVGAPLNSILHIYRADGSWTFLGLYSSGDNNERACASICADDDYDGDGHRDFLIGAPNWDDGSGTQHGRVIVVSGLSILTPHYPPVIITTLTIPSTTAFPFDMHFGARVITSASLTSDGRREIVVGAPDYHASLPISASHGAVSIFSGATFAKLGLLSGVAGEHFGDVLTGGFRDFNGDGFLDFAAAGSVSDVPSSLCGVIKCVSLYPCAPTSYCTSKTNSLGCTPAVSSTGSPSASSITPFLVKATSVLNLKNGLLFYGHAPAAVPYQGGTMCVASPQMRTPAQSSGGSTSGDDCTGTFSYDFNARIHSGVDASLVAGSEIFAQYWSRDPASASTTSLTNALRFLINP